MRAERYCSLLLLLVPRPTALGTGKGVAFRAFVRPSGSVKSPTSSMSQNSASILADKGRLLWVSGRREDGLRLLRQLEQADADAVSPHRYLKFAYFGMGEYAGYLSEMKKEGQLLHDASTPSIEEAAEKGFAAHGARGMLEGELEQ